MKCERRESKRVLEVFLTSLGLECTLHSAKTITDLSDTQSYQLANKTQTQRNHRTTCEAAFANSMRMWTSAWCHPVPF